MGRRIRKCSKLVPVAMHPKDEMNTGQEQGLVPARGYRWLAWVGALLLLLLAAITGLAIVLAHRIEPFLRVRIVDGLAQHFHSRVELDSFHVSVGNGFRGEWGIWAQGHGLRIWPPVEPTSIAGSNAPNPDEPLLSLGSFEFHAPLRYSPGVPVAINEIRLQGLELHLPPRSHFLHIEATAKGSGSERPDSDLSHLQFRLGSVNCAGARLVLETSKPGKLPTEIFIEHFRLTNVQPDAPMNFEAELTNPRPVGAIHTKGIFGPWQVWDPGLSPIVGEYTFAHANLADLKGIGGFLDSTGTYQGTLRNLTVDGQTDTPDFSLSHFGNTMDLKTRFHALVDGTSGDTWLDPVNATLGHSHITAIGMVVRVFAPSNTGGALHSIGHDIDLKIETDHGRIEDFLHLASRDSAPLLTGDLSLKSTLHIPPGQAPVHERMGLKGRFTLAQVKFASQKVEDRIEELSLRGQGRPKEAKSDSGEKIPADIESDFQIAGGAISFPNLAFTVPGADIELHGTYKLDGGILDFQGLAKMQATISKMVGGWKGLLLKPADRFFKKDGVGAEIPIHIDGTYKDPHFGVDVKGVPHTHPQRPDQQPAPEGPQPPATPPASAPQP
jgi:hypothetical protein